MPRLVHLTPGRSGRQGEVGQAGEAVRRLVWRRAGARDRAGGCRWTLPDKREYIWLCADEEEWVQLPCETRCRRTFVGEMVAERKTWQGVWQSIWHVAWQIVWQSNWQGVRQGAHLEQEKGADGGEEEQEVPGEILSLLTISLRNPQFYTNNLSQSKGRGGSRKSKSRRCSCKGGWRGRENPVVQSDAFHIWKILMEAGGEGEKGGEGELPQNLYKLRCSSSRVWFNWQTRALTKMATAVLSFQNWNKYSS